MSDSNTDQGSYIEAFRQAATEPVTAAGFRLEPIDMGYSIVSIHPPERLTLDILDEGDDRYCAFLLGTELYHNHYDQYNPDICMIDPDLSIPQQVVQGCLKDVLDLLHGTKVLMVFFENGKWAMSTLKPSATSPAEVLRKHLHEDSRRILRNVTAFQYNWFEARKTEFTFDENGNILGTSPSQP